MAVKYISVNENDSESEIQGYYKNGDLFEPHIIQKEPLSNLLDEFISIINNKRKFSDKLSLDVVTLLEKMEKGEQIEAS